MVIPFSKATMKVIEKIQQNVEQEKVPMFSFEYFPPKTEQGLFFSFSVLLTFFKGKKICLLGYNEWVL